MRKCVAPSRRTGAASASIATFMPGRWSWSPPWKAPAARAVPGRGTRVPAWTASRAYSPGIRRILPAFLKRMERFRCVFSLAPPGVNSPPRGPRCPIPMEHSKLSPSASPIRFRKTPPNKPLSRPFGKLTTTSRRTASSTLSNRIATGGMPSIRRVSSRSRIPNWRASIGSSGTNSPARRARIRCRWIYWARGSATPVGRASGGI